MSRALLAALLTLLAGFVAGGVNLIAQQQAAAADTNALEVISCAPTST
jgi:hypothetical protein